MGKYAAALGIWKHTIGEGDKAITFELMPEEQDNKRFLEVKDEAKSKESQTLLFQGVANIYYSMVLRQDKTASEQDKIDLKNLIWQNISQITKDMTIAFKWSTEEEMERLEKRMEDELISSSTKKKD